MLRIEVRSKKNIYIYILVGLVLMATCAYGYAAVSTDLLVSGEATVLQSNPFRIDYLQEMTPQVCAEASPEAQARLEDQRDGKKYWVAKLKDGKCWMTQNLHFNITPAMISSNLINSTNTDINVDDQAGYVDLGGGVLAWNANSKYPPVATTDVVANTNTRDPAMVYSYDPGDYLHFSAAAWNTSACRNLSSLANCAIGTKLIDNSYRPTFVIDPSASNRIAIDEASRTYDAHYLEGNYYSYMAATAGSARVNSAAAYDATSSLCPKGWRLINATSLTTELQATFMLYNSNTYSYYSPFHAFYSGYTSGGGIESFLGYVKYWTSHTESYWSNEASATGLNSYGSFERASGYYYTGNTVRCVAR